MKDFNKELGLWQKAILLVCLWTLVGLVFAALFYAGTLLDSRRAVPVSAVLHLHLVLFYVWGVLSLLLYRFSRKFPIDFTQNPIRNLLLHLSVIPFLALVHQLVFLSIVWITTPLDRRQFASLTEYYLAYFSFTLYVDLIIATLIVISSHAFFYYRRLKAAEKQRLELNAQLSRAQLQALQMQLRPHFLFNTLHSISALVLEDPPRANTMIARLGDFLRMTLDQSDQQLVTVKQEMEFLRCFLDIERTRFADRLAVEFAVDDVTQSALVPQLILQPIVENAIRHAVGVSTEPRRIQIAAQQIDGQLCLQVKDDGPGNNREHQGLGLGNVKARLEELYGSDFSFEAVNGPTGGFWVTIMLPFTVEARER